MTTRGSKRRKYIITVMRLDKETAEQCDERVVRHVAALNQGDLNDRVTVSCYDPVANDIVKIVP